MSTGIDTYIVKTASRCNLNCTYCYYYNGADTSYLGRPKFMSVDVVDALVERIISHARKHRLSTVDLTLHGGEPLLMGRERFVDMMHRFDAIDAAGIATRRKCQTNGVLLDEEWASLLAHHRILLGVSIDGPQESHDKNRVDHRGRGSYARAVNGLKLALSAADQGLRTSVLCFINPEHSGTEMYRHLRGLGVERMDFLLPESNYKFPPDGYQPLGPATPYGRYLSEVFDAWIGENNPRIHVRLLDRVVRSALGQIVKSDVIGLAPVRVAVIETDGSLEPTDNFKSCADRMTDLGLNIQRHDLDELYGSQFFSYCIDAASHIPDECTRCEFLSWCGGGRITTRYSDSDQFSRPTIYCNDLKRLYRHVGTTVAAHTASRQAS